MIRHASARLASKPDVTPMSPFFRGCILGLAATLLGLLLVVFIHRDRARGAPAPPIEAGGTRTDDDRGARRLARPRPPALADAVPLPPAPPAEDETRNPAHQREQVVRAAQQLDARLDQQAVDASWASDVQARLTSEVLRAERDLQLLDLRCGATLCRAHLSHPDIAAAGPEPRMRIIRRFEGSPDLSWELFFTADKQVLTAYLGKKGSSLFPN
jgi:hypothetical protein